MAQEKIESIFYLKYVANLQTKEKGTFYKEVIYTNGIEDIDLMFDPYINISFPNILNREHLDLLVRGLNNK